jgi:hypothetical protein
MQALPAQQKKELSQMSEPLSAAGVLPKQTIPNHTLHAILIEDCIFFVRDAAPIPTFAPPSNVGGVPPVTAKLLIGTLTGVTLYPVQSAVLLLQIFDQVFRIQILSGHLLQQIPGLVSGALGMNFLP